MFGVDCRESDMRQVLLFLRLFIQVWEHYREKEDGRETWRNCVSVLKGARMLVAWQSKTLKCPPQGMKVSNFAAYAPSSKS